VVIGERSFATLRMTRLAVVVQIQQGVVAEDDKDGTRLIAFLQPFNPHLSLSVNVIENIILDAGG
jgi:hypothetical protein